MKKVIPVFLIFLLAVAQFGSDITSSVQTITESWTFNNGATINSGMTVDSLKIGGGQFVVKLGLTAVAGSLFIEINNTTAAANDTAWLPLN